MKEKIPRLLRADEIECRVGVIYEHGLSLLLYKDARVDQKILDETFGIYGWKKSHQLIGDSLFCTIEIWDDEKKQWIGKQDVGTKSFTESEKGQVSDGTKRAGFLFGIGRSLYSAPFIWIPSTKVDIGRKGDRLVTNERFHVDEIQYDDERNISYIKILNASNQVVYVWGKPKEKTDGNVAITMVTDEKMDRLRKELQRTGVSMEAVLGRYCITSETQLTEDIYRKAMSSLKRTKSLKQVA